MNTVNSRLTQMIMRGEAPRDTINEIAKQFGVSKNKAGRLVMTESAAFASSAREDCYKELDVEQYKLIETLDSNTCELCGDLDSKIYRMEDYEVGKTAPPWHPWCRGTTAPYFADMEGMEDRFARNAVTGKSYKIEGGSTYKEWKAKQDELHGVGAVDSRRKMSYNRSADGEQYERYWSRLGDAIPLNLEDFQKLKYGDPKAWKELQLRYRYKGIDDRLLKMTPPYKVIDIKNGVPKEFKQAADALDAQSKQAVFAYTDGGVNCAAINRCAATGVASSPEIEKFTQQLHDTLPGMSLPQDTVVFRGSSRKYIRGLDLLEGKMDLKDWVGNSIFTDAFSSTSLFRDTRYEGEVEMTILVPKGKAGAGYINDISNKFISTGHSEYEIILQKNSEYSIIEVQYFEGKLFLVLEWLGEVI